MKFLTHIRHLLQMTLEYPCLSSLKLLAISKWCFILNLEGKMDLNHHLKNKTTWSKFFSTWDNLYLFWQIRWWNKCIIYYSKTLYIFILLETSHACHLVVFHLGNKGSSHFNPNEKWNVIWDQQWQSFWV